MVPLPESQPILRLSPGGVPREQKLGSFRDTEHAVWLRVDGSHKHTWAFSEGRKAHQGACDSHAEDELKVDSKHFHHLWTVDIFITRLEAQGPSRTCIERNNEEEEDLWGALRVETLTSVFRSTLELTAPRQLTTEKEF